MFRLNFGLINKALMTGDVYFDHYIDKSCLETDFARRVIKEVSGGEVFDKNVIVHPIFGGIPPEKLAGGIKSLLILMFDTKNRVVSLSAMGDNCLKFLPEIGEVKDFTVCTDGIREVCFGNPIYVINSDRVIHTRSELIDEYLKFSKSNIGKYDL